jgi:hypothetical protein
MIRPTVTEDTQALLDMTAGTGLFTPADVETLREVLADYFAETRDAVIRTNRTASRSASSTSPRRR